MERLPKAESRPALPTAHHRDLWAIVTAMPTGPKRPKWERLEAELQGIPKPVEGTGLDIRLIAKVCNNKLGSQRVWRHRALTVLFRQVLTQFRQTDTFSILLARIGGRVNKRRTGIAIILKQYQPVFGIWLMQEYPHLSRLLLSRNFRESYSGLLGIPIRQTVQFLPAFVLFRMDALFESPLQVLWVRWMARGKNIRTAPGFPLKLSRKEAHWLCQAPAGSVFSQAILYSFVFGNGGGEGLYQHLSAFYVRQTWDDAWMRALVRFFVRQQAERRMNAAEFRLLMSYLAHHHQENGSFRFKRRSLTALIREARQWEQEREIGAGEDWIAQGPESWPIAPISGFEWQDGKEKWRITQLNTRRSLYEEGVAMHHCVATYVHDCVTGIYSIWSVRKLDAEGNSKRLVTVAVDQYRRIVQARGPYNETPADDELDIINQWAEAARLELIDY